MFIDFLIENWYVVLAIVIILALILFDNRSASGSSIDVGDVAPILNHQQGVVLDIREKDAFDKGHIANSRNIPLAQLEEKIAQIKKWQKKPIIVACNTGAQSKQALKILKANEFQTTYSLAGGIAAWQRDSMPLVTKKK